MKSESVINIKSKESEFYQNNQQFERCVEKQRKMHKLSTKFSKIESKSIDSKNSKRFKLLQRFYKLKFEFEFEFKRKENRKCRSWDAKCRCCAKYAKCTKSAKRKHNTRYKKTKSFNIELRIEKIIDAKMKKIQSHLKSKLNQMINLI